MTGTARSTAALIALLALASLGAQFIVSSADNPGPWATTWSMARYFTILTNLMVVGTFGLAALTGRAPRSFWLAGLVLWVLIVGLVYHLLLYKPHTGLAFWADHGLHTAVPLVTTAWWIAFSRTTPLPVLAPVVWLWWPFCYFLYATLRGALDGKYAYFFIDLDKLSLMDLARNFLGLLVAFLVAGYILWGLSRLARRA
ncbi:Pr6Pr family membrane protein [Mesobacterium pallidum]|uniref:Pr6Pr family membrane protein n=1 Tax=Mesobacterium pallidum TaxID=2872037 RepID=UPI001EE2B505|nr:Pr6Pr family membrane protein [Mesobacterium pallidum]